MAKAYIESNVINCARRAAWSGATLRDRLDGYGLTPLFGLHGIYELARGFLSSQTSRDDIQANFQILAHLDPEFGPTVKMLYEKEIDRLRTGAIVIPVLDVMNHASAKYQVLRMSMGFFEAEGDQFISRRERDIDREWPRFVEYQLEAVQHGVGEQGPDGPRLQTFEDVFRALDDEIPRIIEEVLRRSVTAFEARELYMRLDEFPAIRSVVRAQLYLWAIPILHRTGASRDKLDDYRHVIEASYADVFVTGDEQLARTVPRIHPTLAVFSWADIVG